MSEFGKWRDRWQIETNRDACRIAMKYIDIQGILRKQVEQTNRQQLSRTPIIPICPYTNILTYTHILPHRTAMGQMIYVQPADNAAS